MRVFANGQTHCLLIVSCGFVLVLRESATNEDKKEQIRPSKLFVEFVAEDMLPDIGGCGFREVVLSKRSFGKNENLQINSGLGDIPHFSHRQERKFYGVLGVYAYKGRVHVGFITERAEVGSAVVGERIYRIDNTVFISLEGDCYDYYGESDGRQARGGPSKVGSIQKLLASGTFYYSPDYDMGKCLQERVGSFVEGGSNEGGKDVDMRERDGDMGKNKHTSLSNSSLTTPSLNAEVSPLNAEDSPLNAKNPSLNAKAPFSKSTSSLNTSPFNTFPSNPSPPNTSPPNSAEEPSSSRFVWNGNMISGLLRFRGRLSGEEGRAFDRGRFAVKMVRGFAQSLTIRKPGGLPGDFLLTTIITKQDCRKSGPLLGPYGMDDNGNVANFAESEVVVSDRGQWCSCVVARGNVPLFWELARQLVSTRVEFPRSGEASRHAFARHFAELRARYGAVHVVDALSGKGTQPELSRRYREALAGELGVIVDGGNEKSGEGGKKSKKRGGGDEGRNSRNREGSENGTLNMGTLENGTLKMGVLENGISKKGVSENGISKKGVFENGTSKKGVLENVLKSSIRDPQLSSITYSKVEGDLSSRCSLPGLAAPVDRFGVFWCQRVPQAQRAQQTRPETQHGVVLVNTLDSSRRANFVQARVCERALVTILPRFVAAAPSRERARIRKWFWHNLEFLWDANGRSLARVAHEYNGGLRAKNKRGGLVAKVATQSRRYVSPSPSRNCGRLPELDRLLGRLPGQYEVQLVDPIHDYVAAELARRSNLYVSRGELSVYTVTFNVNGERGGSDLTPLLFPDGVEGKVEKEDDENMSDGKYYENMSGHKYEGKCDDKKIDKSEGDKSDHKVDDKSEGKFGAKSEGQRTDQKFDDHKFDDKSEGHKFYNHKSNPKFFNHKSPHPPYDIVAVGLEEVVELTPGKIMSIDPAARLYWEQAVQAALEAGTSQPYTLVRGEQLGGILALVFVRGGRGSPPAPSCIQEIETCCKKTGLKGMAANKGGVAISFSYAGRISLCFVVSHLAAGFSNTDDRHQDFKAIATGLHFSRGRGLRDFDAVFWMGDFNFRIQASNSRVRGLIARARSHRELFLPIVNRLFESDQLNHQMASGQSFPFFDEHEIRFLPTYKFDKGTQLYDTSDKERVPAWTDRIVTFAKNRASLHQLAYGSIPAVCFSDHRPVYAVFRLAVDVVDRSARSRVEKRLYECRKLQVRAADLIVCKDLAAAGHRVLHYGLPAPSSKGSRWWLAGRSPSSDPDAAACRVRIPQLDSGLYALSPRLPANPFAGGEGFVRNV